MSVRTFRRVVMARRGTRAEAETIAHELTQANPTEEYAVEYTPVALQLEQWRTIHVTDVPEGTPDKHPACDQLRRERRGQLSDGWDGDGYGW